MNESRLQCIVILVLKQTLKSGATKYEFLSNKLIFIINGRLMFGERTLYNAHVLQGHVN